MESAVPGGGEVEPQDMGNPLCCGRRFEFCPHHIPRPQGSPLDTGSMMVFAPPMPRFVDTAAALGDTRRAWQAVLPSVLRGDSDLTAKTLNAMGVKR